MGKTFGDRLSVATTVVLTCCILAMTALLVRREMFPSARTGAPPRPRRVEGWRALAAVGNRVGPATARLQIVEFADYQCPACAMLQPGLDQVRARHPRDVAVVYRHFPLAIHPYAVQAAVAAECAAAQGRFEAYHQALYAAQDSIGQTPWETLAARAGVADTAAFRACRAGPRANARVRQDEAEGRKLGIGGTPTLIIGGWLRTGAPPVEELDRLVREALR